MVRDEFPLRTKDNISKRAAFICSNPDCDNLCIGPSQSNLEDFLYYGKVAHIYAASKGGPRYNSEMTSNERKSPENAIFLCSNCADMIDKNNGIDFSVEILNNWKKNHEKKIFEKNSIIFKEKEDDYTGAEYYGTSRRQRQAWAKCEGLHYLEDFIEPMKKMNRDRYIFKLNKKKHKKKLK